MFYEFVINTPNVNFHEGRDREFKTIPRCQVLFLLLPPSFLPSIRTHPLKFPPPPPLTPPHTSTPLPLCYCNSVVSWPEPRGMWRVCMTCRATGILIKSLHYRAGCGQVHSSHSGRRAKTRGGGVAFGGGVS